nr:hypothetical protein BaRGS_023961 [Batillaria attramentaria]
MCSIETYVQLIAVYTAGNFLPTPTYSSRVQHVPQTGLVLQHVTASDSGNYTVEVNVRSSAGVHTTYTSTVYLNVVTEDTATTAATVHVLQESIPAYDSNTGQYHIRLACTGLSPDITPSSVIGK